MQNSKYNIAFTGVFDIANFGDHLFPMLFETELRKRGVDMELYLFSCIECEQAFGGKRHVYALKNLDKMHSNIKFDAIIVGGGEIIHLHSFKHKINQEEDKYIQYPIYETWVIPSIVAEKNGIPLFWNSPGIPFEFEGFYHCLAMKLFKKVDYLSVRNSFSVEALLKCDIDKSKISFHPDTAFALPYVFKKEDLMVTQVEILGKNKKYIVFHCNQHISENYLNSAIENLLYLYNQGYKIVLLPLAYTNGDDEFAKKINELADYKFITFEEQLSLQQIISILAYCELYIGVSFHGAITTYCYGGKVIGFDFFKNTKTKDLFDMLGIPENYLTDVVNLEETIKRVLTTTKDLEYYKLKILKNLDEHFDNMSKYIKSSKNEIKLSVNDENPYQIISELLENISCDYQKFSGENHNLQSEVNFLHEKWKDCAKHLDNAKAELDNVKKTVYELKKKLENPRKDKVSLRIFKNIIRKKQKEEDNVN